LGRWLVGLISVGSGEGPLQDEEDERGDEGGKEQELDDVDVLKEVVEQVDAGGLEEFGD